MAEEQDIKYFTQIPAWVDELDNITDFQARLIGYIYTFENITGAAFPSNQKIADRFKKSVKTVQTALSDLYSKGIIESQLTYKKESKVIEKRLLKVVPTYPQNRVYPTPENKGTLSPKSSVPSPQNRGEPTPANGVDNILINKSTNRLINNNDHFEEIWSQYPKNRKQGKSKAEKAFNKAIKNGVSPELIKNKLLDYKKQIKAKGTASEYIKQAGTWFYQSGWEDEYDFTPELPKQNKGYGKRDSVAPGFVRDGQTQLSSQPEKITKEDLPEWTQGL